MTTETIIAQNTPSTQEVGPPISTGRQCYVLQQQIEHQRAVLALHLQNAEAMPPEWWGQTTPDTWRFFKQELARDCAFLIAVLEAALAGLLAEGEGR